MTGHYANATMNELRKNGELCDFKIEVEGDEILVHRVVLASCSEYFRNMFKSNMREPNEGSCQLKDITFKVAEICINFMYVGELDITPDIAVEVLKLSHLWQLGKAVDICVEVLSKNLASSNCASIWKLADLYNLDIVIDNCIRYILCNVASMLKEVADLDFLCIKELFKYSAKEGGAPNDPMGLWNLCLGWGASEHYSTQFCEAVKFFPVQLLSYADFFENVWENSHVRGCENCRQNTGKSYLYSGPTITIENCLFLKHLENCYGCETQMGVLTNFIVMRSQAVFARPEFSRYTTENNLRQYIAGIGTMKRRCTRTEFCAIVACLKFDSTWKSIFQRLFEPWYEIDDNLFHKSLTQFDDGIATVEDALFIMKLASEHIPYGDTWNRANNLIVGKFSEATKIPEFYNVTSTDLKKCLRNIDIYEAGEKIIWDGIMKWINFAPDQRNKEFLDIFYSLKLDEFSSMFLRQTVFMSELVMENKACISRLLEFVFDKLDASECKIKSMEERVSVLESKQHRRARR